MTNRPDIPADDFASPQERAECDEDFVALEHSLPAEFRGPWDSVPLGTKWLLWLAVRRACRRYQRAGVKHEPAIVAEVTGEVSRQERFGSLLLIIGLAVLGEVVKWLVRMWLERRETNQ